MSLTLEEANRIIRGALAKAQELNIKISAAVCDSGGRLIALQRMDNAIWASAYGCQGKAVASAAEAMARNPGAQAGIRFALILGLVLIESLALYTLVITYVAK